MHIASSARFTQDLLSTKCGLLQLVALAGLVWNAPTSCAWAARVYVSNR